MDWTRNIGRTHRPSSCKFLRLVTTTPVDIFTHCIALHSQHLSSHHGIPSDVMRTLRVSCVHVLDPRWWFTCHRWPHSRSGELGREFPHPGSLLSSPCYRASPVPRSFGNYIGMLADMPPKSSVLLPGMVLRNTIPKKNPPRRMRCGHHLLKLLPKCAIHVGLPTTGCSCLIMVLCGSFRSQFIHGS